MDADDERSGCLFDSPLYEHRSVIIDEGLTGREEGI